MRSRPVTLVAVAVAVAAVAVVIIRFAPSGRPAMAHASLPTGPASYLGVYETGPPRYYGAAVFARTWFVPKVPRICACA